jgi:hypothetical protein
MAKSSTKYLLIPGETEWEIWSIVPNQPAALEFSHAVNFASEIEKFPAGDLIFLFPIQAFTALPLRVQTTDPALFPDLAATHAERLGLRPDPLAGQLTDIFPISTSNEESTLLSVVLRNPSSESLPSKSPKAFDISARALPTSGNTLTLWRELNHWVFAIHHQGKLVYCQATSSTGISPDANLVREIRIATTQLSLQGIQVNPDKAIVWSTDEATQTTELSKAFSIPVELTTKPTPTLPDPLSQLLPADVRAARRAAQKRQNTLVAFAALAIFYIGAIGYFSYDLWKSHSTIKQLTTREQEIAPSVEKFVIHNNKWDELEYAITSEYNTMDILLRIQKCIPPNTGLRLKTAEISATNIRLIGEAPQSQAVTQFASNLKKSNELLNYEWSPGPPQQTAVGWEFTHTANLPQTTP